MFLKLNRCFLVFLNGRGCECSFCYNSSLDTVRFQDSKDSQQGSFVMYKLKLITEISLSSSMKSSNSWLPPEAEFMNVQFR
jgi:hypothetical protein